MTKVALTHCSEYTRDGVLAALRKTLQPLGGMGKFVRPGQRVLLKANLLGAFAPEEAVTTHPAVVAAMIRLVREAEGIPVVGDSPGSGGLKRALQISGIGAVCSEFGVEIAEFTETQLFEQPENRVAKRIELARAVEEADVIISLPKLKMHAQMDFTCALKNQFGLVVGVEKSRYHYRLQDRDWLAALMIDINRTAKPALAVVDAIVGMEGNGPSGGEPRPIGALVAGADLAAVDTVCAALVGLDTLSTPLGRAAQRSNYGTVDLREIEICGTPLEELQVPDFKRPDHACSILDILPLPPPFRKLIRHVLTPQPRIIASKCIHCGACAKGCPLEPAAINPDNAEINGGLDSQRCIRCYCCHEFCPVKAIELRRSWFDRIFFLNAIANCCARWIEDVRSWRHRGK